MQIWRYAEQGSINFLWIICTNPAVSLPKLHRIRDILRKEDLFVVVQDIFLTETAQFADVVLPAATWGEKTARSRTQIARSISRRRASSPRARRRPTWTYSSTTPGGWIFGTRTGSP
jgi:anaerobic selenocysteine-containing dehydrogenase